VPAPRARPRAESGQIDVIALLRTAEAEQQIATCCRNGTFSGELESFAQRTVRVVTAEHV
jgi:hypothetical protein